MFRSATIFAGIRFRITSEIRIRGTIVTIVTAAMIDPDMVDQLHAGMGMTIDRGAV